MIKFDLTYIIKKKREHLQHIRKLTKIYMFVSTDVKHMRCSLKAHLLGKFSPYKKIMNLGPE